MQGTIGSVNGLVDRYHGFTVACSGLWSRYRTVDGRGQGRSGSQIEGLSRNRLRELIKEAVDILSQLRRADSGSFEVALQYYELLRDLADLDGKDGASHLGSKVEACLRNSTFVNEGWATATGEKFAESMRNLGHLLRVMMENHREFFQNLDERVDMVAEHVLTDWAGKFTAEKTLLMMLMICWSEEARPDNGTVDLKRDRFTPVLLAPRIPVRQHESTEVRLSLFSEFPYNEKLRIVVDFDAATASSSRIVIPERDDSREQAWGFVVKPTWRFGAYDFQFRVRLAPEVRTFNGLEGNFRLSVHLYGNEGQQVGGGKTSVAFVLSGMGADFGIPELPVADWISLRCRELLDARQNVPRIVLCLPRYRIAGEELGLDALKTLLKNLLPNSTAIAESAPFGSLIDRISSERASSWLVEVPNREQACRLAQEVCQDTRLEGARIWLVHFSDLMQWVFPWLYFEGAAAERFEDLLWPVTRDVDHAAMYRALNTKLGPAGAWKCTVAHIEELYDGRILNIAGALNASWAVLCGREGVQESYLRKTLVMMGQATATQAEKERLEPMRADVTRIALELGQIYRYATDGESELRDEKKIFDALRFLVEERWCRFEGLRYSFNSNPHFRFVQDRFVAREENPSDSREPEG